MADRVRNEGYEVDVDRGEEGMFRVFVDRGHGPWTEVLTSIQEPGRGHRAISRLAPGVW